ncbi:unnamed protein product, partial [Ilex paraguariensis]
SPGVRDGNSFTEWGMFRWLKMLSEVVGALVPFLKWCKHPLVEDAAVRPYNFKEIRIAAASAMPKILNSATEVVEYSDPQDYDQNMQYVETLSNMVIGALEEASDLEPDEDVRFDILYALNDCVQ